jgi:hypothetical protein
MLISEILNTLPAPLEWMVLFNLPSIRTLADETTTRAMYHLPAKLNLDDYSHVVLCDEGRFLAFRDRPQLVEPISGKNWSSEQIETSLYSRFASRLALFAIDEADCLGLGETAPFSPVILHLKIESGCGKAQAIFDREPSGKDYELLRAVGVKFLGGEVKDDYYLANFQNRLPIHIHAGILSHFSRTAHCNLFFLQHGNIDQPLKTGLLKAAASRVNWGRNKSFQALAKLANEACQQTMAMICQPPLPDRPFFYGDLVPLGFVLKALDRAKKVDSSSESAIDNDNSIATAHHNLSQFLQSKRQDNLWAFHSDRLITSTDSALILQGLKDNDGVESLECFADGEGGYYPQLWSKDKQPGKMVFDDDCAHWCQADYGTTCLVRALQHEAGVPTKTSIAYLAAGMENRSGLYFANPYLVDWALARAIGQDKSAESLRQKLLEEILASINEDYSFGLYDIALSTALAILSMDALGFRGRTIRVAQLRLLEFMDNRGLFPEAKPFYSSLEMDREIASNVLLKRSMSRALNLHSLDKKQEQIQQVQGEYYGISLYVDTHKTIATALAALALAVECEPQEQDLDLHSAKTVNPRYQCRNHSEYIAKFALPPYLAKKQLVESVDR